MENSFQYMLNTFVWEFCDFLFPKPEYKQLIETDMNVIYLGYSRLFVCFCVGCPQNSVDTEFRLFFLLPSIPYSVRNWLKFRGILLNSVLYNIVKFRDFFHTKITY